MSPRPRTVHDDAILEAAIGVLSRIGPEKMTLADVGSAVGLSAATLVQRFGSKRELMLALLRYATGDIASRFEAAAEGQGSCLDALFAAATSRPGPIDGSVSFANRMSFYMSQLNDPEFREIAVENGQRAVAGYKRLLDSAVKGGELSIGYTDTDQLAETIYSMMMGSLVTWAVMNEGTYQAKIRRDLDLLLRPFRRGPRKAAPSVQARVAVGV